MQKIDLIALDLDGTALTPDNTVSDATQEAVRRAREAGLRVVISTGRICGEARDFALQLGADDLMVTSGGASLSSVSREQCIMRMSMPWEPAVRAAAAVERIGVTAMIYVGETLLITPYDDMEFGRYKSNEGYLAVKQVVPSVAEYIADHRLSVDKIFARMQRSGHAGHDPQPGGADPRRAGDELGVGQYRGGHTRRGQGHGARHAVPRAGHRLSSTPPRSATAKTTWRCCARSACRSRWAMQTTRSRPSARGRR